MTATPDDFFSPAIGLYVTGTQDPGPFPYLDANYWQNWERPVEIAVYSAAGVREVALKAGVKVFGGHSRTLPQKSLSVFARSVYGSDDIAARLFADRPSDSYQSFVLRNSGGDWNRSLMRDGMMTSLMRGSGLDVQAYRPAVLYLNGAYHGIHNLREKVNENYFARHHGVAEDDLDLLEFGGDAIHGSAADYLELMDYVRERDELSAAELNHVAERVDLDNLALYYSAQIYFSNRDWPHNNIKYWRAAGGKWRWVLFDTDWGFNFWTEEDYANDHLRFVLDNNASLLIRKLLTNEAFRNRFVNRYADELNSRFLPTAVITLIDTLAQRIAGEVPAHSARWNGTPDDWSGQVERMRTFAERRPATARQHLLDYFNLSDHHPLTVGNDAPGRGSIRVNSLRIRAATWSGRYFAGVPVTLTAVPDPGFEFVRWEGDLAATAVSLTVEPGITGNLRAVFRPATGPTGDVVINEINYASPDELDSGDWVELTNTHTAEISLDGWVLRDGNDDNEYRFPDRTVLPAGGFLVLARRSGDFRAVHPEVALSGSFDFGLSSGGEAVRLYDGSGELRDRVDYLPDVPWPAAGQSGATLELLSPELDNSLAVNWGTVNINGGSPGRSNKLDANTVSIPLPFSVSAAPNPSGGDLWLRFDSDEPHDFSLRIIDGSGRVIRQMTGPELPAGTQRYRIATTELPSGLYFLAVQVGTYETVTLRWLKQ